MTIKDWEPKGRWESEVVISTSTFKKLQKGLSEEINHYHLTKNLSYFVMTKIVERDDDLIGIIVDETLDLVGLRFSLTT